MVRISLYLFSLNAGKYGPEKTAYLDTFHAVVESSPGKVRMNAEWNFGDITNYLKFLDFKKGPKLQFSEILCWLYCK